MSEQPQSPDPPEEPDAEARAPWYVRFERTRTAAWLTLARPLTFLWFFNIGQFAVLAASHGDMHWSMPMRYGAMLALFAAGASMINDALDSEIDGKTRLMRPIPAGRVEARSALMASAIPLAGGAAIGLTADWRAGVLGLAMLAAAALYCIAWRGSVMSLLAFALIGVLVPIAAIQMGGTTFSTAHLLWTIPVGGLTGAAAFMIYKLPDFEKDDEDGSRSVLHWLGIDTAVAMTLAILTAALALAGASINVSGGSFWWLVGPMIYLILAALFCILRLMRGIIEIRLWIQRVLILPVLPVLIVCWLGAAGGA